MKPIETDCSLCKKKMTIAHQLQGNGEDYLLLWDNISAHSIGKEHEIPFPSYVYCKKCIPKVREMFREIKPEELTRCKNCGWAKRMHYGECYSTYTYNQTGCQKYEPKETKPEKLKCAGCGKTECEHQPTYKPEKPHLVYHDMMHCNKCNQITNHRNGVCQKCEKAGEKR